MLFSRQTFSVKCFKFAQKNVQNFVRKNKNVFSLRERGYGCNVFDSNFTSKERKRNFVKNIQDDRDDRDERRNDKIKHKCFKKEAKYVDQLENATSKKKGVDKTTVIETENANGQDIEQDFEQDFEHELEQEQGPEAEQETEQDEMKYVEEENDAEVEEGEALEDEDEIGDDIDTLLYTNNLNSSFIGELWHTSANSYYKSKELENENIIKKKTETETNKENDKKIEIEMEIRMEKEDNKINRSNKMHNIGREEKGEKKKDTNSDEFVKKIYEEEKREVEELQEYFEKNGEKLTKFRNTVYCRLKLAEELSQKYDHASKNPFITTEQEMNKRKEEHYKKMINAINGNYNEESNKKKKKKNLNYNYDNVETIKILDIDSLPCNVLNHLFAYKIVKHCSAEICLKIITRLGMYRDKYTQVSYENMITYLGKIITNEKNAEIIALFCRCYETVSVPFLINYVRKYGSFSRSFLVNMYDKFFRKRLFDFVRYENNMGVRKIPNILTHPHHLSSYVKLLGECSAKKDMYIQLKMRNFIPNSYNYELPKLEEDNYSLISNSDMEKRKMKKIHLIEPKEKEEGNKNENGNGNRRNNKKKNFVERPKMYDVILSAEYSGLPIENFIEIEKDEPKQHIPHPKDVKQMESHFKLLKDKTFIDKMPLSEETQVSLTTEQIMQKEMNIEDMMRQEINREDINQEEMNQEEMNQEEINQKEINQEEMNEEEINQVEIKKEKEEEKTKQESVNFTIEEECDIYLYKKLNRLNSVSHMLQTTLVKTNEETERKNELIEYGTENENDFDKIKEVETYSDSLWDLPWKTRKRDSFFYKGRFFKIVPGEGWKQIEEVSKMYIRPKRKRQKHYVRRKRVLQKKMKINLFKKKILEKNKKNEKRKK